MKTISIADNINNKIKVLYLSHSAELSGGGEICLLTLLRHLDRESIEPIVLFPTDGPFKDAVERLLIKTYIVPMEWWVETEYGIPFQDESFAERVGLIGEIIAQEQPDIIHTNTSVLWEGAVAARIHNVRHVWHIHEVLAGHPSLTPVLPLSLLYFVIETFTDRVVAVSDTEKRELTRYISPDKITTIHNGVEARQFSPETGISLREELGIAAGDAIALTLASLARFKGIDTLLDAALLVKENNDKIRFVLAGSGTDDAIEALNKKIARLGLVDVIHYLGFRSDVEHLLAAANFLVVSSINESFSLVTAEAMAAGKTVITTDCGGPAELVIDGETGFIVPVGDASLLREKMLQLTADEQMMKTMGNNGRKRFMECFTADIYAEKFLLLYKEISRFPGLPTLTGSESRLIQDAASFYQNHLEKMKKLLAQERIIAEKNYQIAERNQQIELRDNEIKYQIEVGKQNVAGLEYRLNQQLAELEYRLKQQLVELEHQLASRDLEIQNLDAQLQQREELLGHKTQQLRHKDELLNATYDSLSWRVTKPLRKSHAFIMRSLISLEGGKRQAPSVQMLPEKELLIHEQLLGELRTGKGSTFDVIVFPVIDWHFRIQRPQHLAMSLAREGHRTFYLTIDFIVSGEPGFQLVENPAENVFIVRLVCSAHRSLNVYQDVIGKEQRQSLVASLLSLFDSCGVTDLVSIIDLPFWQSVATALPGNLVVYDCMDHHAGFATNSNRMLREEQQLLAGADLVITTSERLSQIVAKKAANIIIRNGAEVDFFSKRPQELQISQGKPVVGYYGAIAEWFDIDLVIAAARACPDWEFVLIGSTAGCETREARNLANITFIGEVPYGSLPGYLYAFDVCMIPFKVIELTLCTNPVKVYEYLSAGKPVVSTALPEVQLMGDVVHCASSTPQFITALQVAMLESSDTELARRRATWAQQHDWRERARQLTQTLHGLFPKVSVVVLTYNNLDLTKECLASLLTESVYPEWELIIVDNASSDGSREYLTEFAQLHPQTKLILNDKNLGFAAGNNVGLKVATGDYLVILNNDTRVTPGWMTDLVRHLRRNEHLGLVGPVTNSIGNEAQIAIVYHKIEEMRTKAAEYTSSHARKRIDVETVAFFCVAMRRSTWEKVGPLDEAFTVGFFEDDDYCRRVAQAGLKVAIAEDVFVHHQHSASFNILPPEEKQAIFERNKQVFEAKWGKWIPHAYRSK